MGSEEDRSGALPQRLRLSELPKSPSNTPLLTTMPPELVTHILACLVPDYPEIGETRPVSYDKLVPGEAWYDYTRNRHGLRSLCLTSRGLRAVAQPLLYRVVSVLDEEGMVLLFRTLSERPELGESTRYFSCHLTLTSDSVIRETKRAIGRKIKTFPAEVIHARDEQRDAARALRALQAELPKLSMYNGDYDDIPQLMMFYIFTFMQKLDTVMLQVPICRDDPDYIALLDRFLGWSLPSMRSVDRDGGDDVLRFRQGLPPRPHFEGATPPPEDTAPAAKLPLQHVKSLLLQGDPEMMQHFARDDCDCQVLGLLGVKGRFFYSILALLPSLTTLEVSSDDGMWSNVRHQLPNGCRAPSFEHIEHLYLHNSNACPYNLYRILVNAPKLRTLYMTPRRDDYARLPIGTMGMMGTAIYTESLDTALMKKPKQLRHLDIAWFDLAGHESLIGPEGRLACLPHLTNLEKLYIQLAVLYGTDRATKLVPMVNLLPPSLVELTLEEWFWEDFVIFEREKTWANAERVDYYQSKSQYRAQAIAIFSRFATDCRDYMPKLRSVTFLTKIAPTWCLEGYVCMDSHFEKVKELFHDRGVEFVVGEV